MAGQEGSTGCGAYVEVGGGVTRRGEGLGMGAWETLEICYLRSTADVIGECDGRKT